MGARIMSLPFGWSNCPQRLSLAHPTSSPLDSIIVTPLPVAQWAACIWLPSRRVALGWPMSGHCALELAQIALLLG